MGLLGYPAGACALRASRLDRPGTLLAWVPDDALAAVPSM
jgi:hypothetical protein